MCNYLSVRRDPYIVIASMQESDTGSVYTKEGLFVDLYEDKYPVVERVLVEPGQEKLLFDLEKIKEDVDDALVRLELLSSIVAKDYLEE